MRIGVDPDRILEASDAVVPHLVSATGTGGRVCRFCRTWLPSAAGTKGVSAAEGTSECENCIEVREALGTTPLQIAVVSLYSKPSPLRDILTRYKGRDDEDDPFDSQCAEVVKAIFGRYVVEHGAALEDKAGGIDAIVVVPSTEREPPHPLEGVIASLELDKPLLHALERGPGDMRFRKPDKRGFQTQEMHPPARVLLVDDVYTTGSRLNSAAYALREAGHTVAASFVLARRINPSYSEEAGRLWVAARGSGFDWRDSPCT